MRVETNKINATDYRGIFEEIKTKYPDIDEAEQMAAAEYIYTNDEDYETSTEADFGRSTAEYLLGNEHEGAVIQNDLTCDIPDGDYTEMVAAGIENPNSRKYWEGFNSALNTEPKNLDDLLEQIKSGVFDHLHLNGNGWTELPVFGGAEPVSTVGVWSWDPTRLLVGTCSDDMKIINRG